MTRLIERETERLFLRQWRLAFQRWGKGLALEATQEVLRVGFGALGFQEAAYTVYRVLPMTC